MLIISYASTVVSNDYKVFIIIANNNCLIPKYPMTSKNYR